jgi:outer membrane beta-barrel protein
MKRALLLAALLPFAAHSQERPAAGTSPNDLPPVTAQLFHVGGLLEVMPVLSVSLGDPFYRTVAAGVRFERHLDERWSLGGHVLGGVSVLAAPVQLCGDGPCSSPASDRLRSAPGQLQLMVGAELGWAPIYGKISLLGERTLHFDAYVSVGPELLRERIAPDAASAVSGRWEPGGRVSLGERLFISDRFVLRVAASELLYVARVRGRSELERKLTIEGGVAWLFGAGR